MLESILNDNHGSSIDLQQILPSHRIRLPDESALRLTQPLVPRSE